MRGAYLALSLVLLLALTFTPVLSGGIVNGYCTGTATDDPCPLSLLSNHSSIINSVSIASYKISNAGLVEPCNKTTPGCTFTVDVESYNHNISLLTPPLRTLPLIFDNDGNTIHAFRSMLASNLSSTNIAYIVKAAVTYGYSGISMDWEPSCWASKPSQCEWPSIAESAAYTAYLVELASALHAVHLPLTVCADVEQCGSACKGDAYIAACLNDELSMGTCNCCAFSTWFNTSALCQAKEIDTISVMDTYEAPFNAQRMQRAVQPWFNAGCDASRLSLGLLQNQATTAQQAEQMMAEVTKLGVNKVDIWTNPWTTKTLIGVWDAALEAFIKGSHQTVEVDEDIPVVVPRRERKRGD